jgi:hypothetical protein
LGRNTIFTLFLCEWDWQIFLPSNRAGSLRLRAEKHPIRPEDSWFGEESESQRLGEHDRHASAAGHESFKTCRLVL